MILTVVRALFFTVERWSSCNLSLFYKDRKGFLRHLFCLIKPKQKISSRFICSSLLFGLVFVPVNVSASIFSSLFGDAAIAGVNTEIIEKNSQSMDLLEANVSSSFVLDKKSAEKDEIDLEKDVQIIAENTLAPSSSLASTKGADVLEGSASDQISVYVVRKGDSIAQIAQMFDVSVNTILWANDLKKGDKLVEGDVLIILPVSGVSHTVLKGQTLKGIAKKYNVNTSDIAAINGISEDEKLIVGNVLIIPDAEIVDIPEDKPVSKPSTYIVQRPLKILEGYFTNPVPNYKRKSQGLHGKNGVDLAAPTGTTIVAAAPGVVIFARKGYNGGYGNMVVIQHPNGTQTLYGHMYKILTSAGAVVGIGETIGQVGSTGRSTGPHLHFEVRGARNPAQDL